MVRYLNIPLCENYIFKESHAASFCLVAALWRLILTFNFIRRDIIAIKSDIKNTLASCTDNEQATWNYVIRSCSKRT